MCQAISAKTYQTDERLCRVLLDKLAKTETLRNDEQLISQKNVYKVLR